MTIRVLVCDDQALVRAGFRKLLEADPDQHVVGEAIDGVDAVQQACASSPDVVLMDIRMPGMDGIAATRHVIRAGGDRTRILILTTFSDQDKVFEDHRDAARGVRL